MATAEDGAAVRMGLLASGAVPEQLALELAEDLPVALTEHVGGRVRWEVTVRLDALTADATATATSMIEAARSRMLREGWDLAICVTDLPLRVGRRPVVADASAIHGVALVSLPALGAVQLRRRAREAILRLVDGLMGESLELGPDADAGGRRLRVRRRIGELAGSVRRVVPEDEDVDARFVAAVVRGNLRLLAGMVRANRPWLLVAGLSRSLAAALATVAFALVTGDVWRLAVASGPTRLAALTLGSLAVTVVALILVHGLWERSVDGRGREHVVLFNVATTLTLAVGIVTLYVALFAATLVGAALVIDRGALTQAVGQNGGVADHLRIAWLVASLATVGGALGAAVESDAAVRQAAYGYRPERRTERESREQADL